MPRPSTINRRSVTRRRADLFVRQSSYTETVATNVTGLLTPGNDIGNLLVLNIGYHSTSITVSTVADTGLNTWTRAGGNATNKGEQWYSLTTAVSGTLTVTLSSPAAKILNCLEFENVPASPLDVFQSNFSAASQSPDTGASSNTGQANEVVVAFVDVQANTVVSAQTAGYTVLTALQSIVTANSVTLQSAYLFLSSTGTQEYASHLANSSLWSAMLGTYKTN